MENKVKLDIPTEVREVSRILSAAGFENFLVGGCVRDILLGRIPKDWDYATNATPEEIQKIFPDSFYENEFGTVGVKTESVGIVEVTPYRLESSYSDARHPDKVRWGTKIEDDLRRRDFTVNAIALSLRPELAHFPSGLTADSLELIDPFKGQEDIQRKIIKTVGDPDKRFSEDALRMFRALRLSAELGFALSHETQSAIGENANLLEKISKERIRDEFVKIIMSENPAIALDMAARIGLLYFISPEFEKGIGVEQNKAHAYTVWEHLLRSLNHAAAKKFPLHVRLAALFHDIGKPHTRVWKNEQWTFYGHEVVGSRLARKILEDLRFPKDILEKTVKLVRWHMFFSDTEQISLSAVRRMIRNVGPELVWDLMDTRIADRIGTGRPKEQPYRLRKYKSMIEEVLRDPISVRQLMIKGGDIISLTKMGPGPNVGFILEILLSEVLTDPKLNTKEYLEKRVLELSNLSKKELMGQGIAARASNEGEEEKEIAAIREEYKVQ